MEFSKKKSQISIFRDKLNKHKIGTKYVVNIAELLVHV